MRPVFDPTVASGIRFNRQHNTETLFNAKPSWPRKYLCRRCTPEGEAMNLEAMVYGKPGKEAAGTCAMVQADSITPNRVVGIYPAAMEDRPGRLRDKLYWRRTRGEWHCFEKMVHGFMSLCPRREMAAVHGQQIARPEADLRCSVCDRLEMKNFCSR
jgi:hypothetical protein